MTQGMEAAQAALLNMFSDTPVGDAVNPSGVSWFTNSLSSENCSENYMSNDDIYTSSAPTYIVKKVHLNGLANHEENFTQGQQRIIDDRNSEIKCTSNKKNNDSEKLDRLSHFYKSSIKELPPVHVCAATVVSNSSRRAALSSRSQPFKYNDTIEPVQKSRRIYNKKFNPRFNSTANGNGSGVENKENMTWSPLSSVSDNNKNLKRKLSDNSIENTRIYITSRSRTIMDRTRAIQTMLTMDKMSEFTEMLSSANHFETYIAVDKVQNAETFRLSERKKLRPCSTPKQFSAYSNLMKNDCDWNVHELTDGVRARVVNWLVKLDDHIGGNLLVLQTAVHFLDQLSLSFGGQLPSSALVSGAACFWVAAKLQCSRAPGAALLVRLGRGGFTKEELLRCEQRVLAALAFPPAPLLPADEIERLADVCGAGGCDPADRVLVEGAHFVCCCALLHATLTLRTPPTQLAAAALAVAARALGPPTHPLNRQLSNLRDSADGWSTTLAHELERACRAACAPACACREPFVRYSSTRRLESARRLAAAFATP